MKDNTFIVILIVLLSSLIVKLTLIITPYCSINGIINEWASFGEYRFSFLGVNVLSRVYDLRLFYIVFSLPVLVLLVSIVLHSIKRGKYANYAYQGILTSIELDILNNIIFIYSFIIHKKINICTYISSMVNTQYETNIGTIVLGDLTVHNNNFIIYAMAITLAVLATELYVYTRKL